MQLTATEKLLARILAYGAAFTTIFIISGSVTDPVNAPKFLSIGVIGLSALGIVISSQLHTRLGKHKGLLLTLGVFALSMLIAVLNSKSPLSQNIYGSYGRNNGLLAYLFLGLILVAGLSINAVENFKIFTRTLILAGVINIAYCLWVILFGDFIGWSNPYGNILGTLGNPDFISAFLGFFFSAYLAYGIGKDSNKYFRYSMVLVLPLTAFEIVDSHAIQGRVVAALGTGIVLFFYLRSRFNNLVVLGYSIFTSAIGVVAVAGALQMGPLTKYIYKTSVSLRGQYWLAGWNTGKSHPLTGVGMDSFGDWYRRTRSLHALELPGVNVVVNTAHNVWMDMFAFGGWPLLLSYLTILLITGVAIFKVVVRSKSYDAIFVALTVAWIGYQAQSIISINQIGLAVWGWLLSGVLIAYERATRSRQDENLNSSPKKGTKSASGDHSLAIMAGTFGAVIGLLLALPPITADVKWRSAQLARTAQAIESTMVPNYFNPQNANKYLNNIQALETSNLFDLSHKYALLAINWNSENYDMWKFLYLLKNSTPEEKALALTKMKELDPLNPDVSKP